MQALQMSISDPSYSMASPAPSPSTKEMRETLPKARDLLFQAIHHLPKNSGTKEEILRAARFLCPAACKDTNAQFFRTLE
jgi:hypothetical protein